MSKRVRNFLNHNYNTNTHSLRYACVDYLLYAKKLPKPVVAKYIGHKNTKLLTLYTRQKQSHNVGVVLRSEKIVNKNIAEYNNINDEDDSTDDDSDFEFLK